MECAFCDNPEVTDRTIIENGLAFAFPTYQPIVPGHVLVCPKRHVQYREGMTPDEMAAIEELRTKVKNALKAAFGAQGFNYAWNEESMAGQSVPHFHLHIVPRTEGDAGVYQYEPRDFLYRPRSRAVSPAEELKEVVRLIQKAL